MYYLLVCVRFFSFGNNSRTNLLLSLQRYMQQHEEVELSALGMGKHSFALSLYYLLFYARSTVVLL